MAETFLVTGATGKTAELVAHQLRAAGQDPHPCAQPSFKETSRPATSRRGRRALNRAGPTRPW